MLSNIYTLKNRSHSIRMLYFLAMSAFCFILSVSRVIVTGQFKFLFLNWNLFLAFVPWALSTWLVSKKLLNKNRWVLLPLILAWLVFFPNAPYILTDFIHLKGTRQASLLFDIILIFSFGWTGLMFGFSSLMDIEIILESYTFKYARIIISAFLFLSGYGIYLGRIMRINSWDIIYNPFLIFHILCSDIIHPLSHAKSWGITLLLGILLNMLFWSLKFVKGHNTNTAN